MENEPQITTLSEREQDRLDRLLRSSRWFLYASFALAGLTALMQTCGGGGSRLPALPSHLAVVAVLNSAISLYYYARIVRTMFFDFPRGGEGAVAVSLSNGALLVVLTSLTVVLGVYWAPVIALADRSVQFFTG